ncbi:GFA family protein [Undibacterium sp. Ji67W]|uniref:GFA family protein n=1 Tax=Undibacterium sp. Ji67W TaxID=3413042 RepID=UPI003BF1BA1B
MTKESANQANLHGSCHCGAVSLTLPSMPETAVRCNCSLCRRLGGLWAYFPFGSVIISGHPAQTADYVWGDKTLRTIRCKICGCVTHWEPINGEPGARHGVNLNNFSLQLREAVKIRHFDGADTWTYIDS